MPRTPRPHRIIRGIPRDCDCTTPRPHGTHHTYEYHSCGCDTCLTGARRYRKQSRALHAQGLTRRRAAGPVRARIELLHERGLTYKQIAAHAGLAHTTLYLIVRKNRATVTARVHHAVIALPIPPRTTRKTPPR